MDAITLRPIGLVRNGRTDPRDAAWGALVSRIEVEPAFAGGLSGLEQWSHLVVVCWLHADDGKEPVPPQWRRHPRGRTDLPRLGVFAQRGRMRPNPIGVTTVAIERVEPGAVVVRGLDALDGTPVLDLKPHAAIFDAPAGPLEPRWFTEMMRGYF